jgi:hypothetical protein
MTKSAQAVGMRDITIVLEPEAASYSVQRQPSVSIEPHQRYMIVDCGGGTVDLVTHELQEDGTVKEVAVGSGGCCGGTYVDQAYLLYLGEQFPFLGQFKRTKQSHYLKMLANWEMTKTNFTGTDRSTIIDFPPGFLAVASEHLDVETLADLEDGFEISAADMRALFDGVVDRILELVDKQLADSGLVHRIVFVGGFSRSKYLQQRAKTALETEETNVVFPPSPESAVLRGAVLLRAAADVFIKERVMRQTYGICASVPYKEGIHDPMMCTMDSKGQLMATNGFFPFVLRKQTLQHDEQVCHNFHAAQPDVVMMLYASNATEAPTTIAEAGVALLGRVCIPNLEVGSSITIGMTFGDTAIHVVVTTSEGVRPLTFHLD